MIANFVCRLCKTESLAADVPNNTPGRIMLRLYKRCPHCNADLARNLTVCEFREHAAQNQPITPDGPNNAA